MEEFTGILETIKDVGGLVILAGLFIYVFITDRREKREEKSQNTQILKELSNSNCNIAESLNLLKTSIDINTQEYKQHDERAIQQFNSINEKLVEIKLKVDK